MLDNNKHSTYVAADVAIVMTFWDVVKSILTSFLARIFVSCTIVQVQNIVLAKVIRAISHPLRCLKQDDLFLNIFGITAARVILTRLIV